MVLTGIGVISPIGSGKEAFWEALLAGKNGIDRITRFDASECASQIAGEVKDFNPEDFIDKKEVKRMDRYTQFAVAASKMAVEDAGLDLVSEDRDRIGTYIGSGVGGIDTLPLVVGFIAAFVSGCLACKWMIGIVKRGKLIYFGIYCSLAGVVTILCSTLNF